MASNYDDVLDQMQAYGLEFGARDLPIEVGRMRRVRVEGDRERRGWYILHELRLDDGDMVLVGSFGIWRGADNGAQKLEIKKRTLTAEQKTALKARLAEDRKRAQAARKAEAARAAARAERVWRQCSATTDKSPDYLARKGIHAYGVKFTPSGAIVVPMFDASMKVHGLQFILSRNTHGERIKRTGRDKEYWPTGLVKQGHFFMLGAMPTGLALVAEGYATAASLHQATGLPVAVAFDAGNLQPVAQALRKRYRGIKLLICADDDALGKCPHCKKLTEQPAATCAHCGGDTSALANAGTSYATAAALAVEGAWIAPIFADPTARQTAAYTRNRKITDFNDLHALEGLTPVRAQVEAKLLELGWMPKDAPAPASRQGGRGDAKLRPIETPEELLERFALIYGHSSTAFDYIERMLVSLSDMRDACTHKEIHRRWMENPERKIVRIREVGFDPAGTDKNITCNLYGGWPTVPKQGNCAAVLELLEYLCEAEQNARELYHWVLKWLAYPIQHPGAKMKTALIFHGPQGVGKNLFFEAVMAIYGDYGRIVDQAAVEDKFNDWMSKKLFLIADEVVARQELFHIKNKIKGLITTEWIRINPKNVAAYEEKNHANLVFLSNETQPLHLERDDRRFVVVWTPPKLPAELYAAVKAEIDNGGVAALHHYLATLDLGDFAPHTNPPMTAAKAALIDLGMDSTERFVRDWLAEAIEGVKALPCKSETLYGFYRDWCAREGYPRYAPQPRFMAEILKRGNVTKQIARYQVGQTQRQATFLFPPHYQQPADKTTAAWLSACESETAEAVRAWKDERSAA